MKKIALIFGVTGQDGSYLSRLLLKKDYVVHGVIRRSSSINTKRIDDIYQEPFTKKKDFILHYGDVTDGTSVFDLIKQIKPKEIYNLAAQSHVAVSFQVPEYTTNADALGTLRILDSIIKINPKIKYYQAGSSEMYGKVQSFPQTEKTPFYPRSPYAVSKVYAHWITINYRESYNIFASNGILFNHESPLRGETFVTKKIVKALCKIKQKKQKKLYLGNIYAKRDWGHAKDYVEAQWLMLQQNTPDDYVIATGIQHSVRELIEIASEEIGIKIKWKGKGADEIGYDEDSKKPIIKIDPRYFRPTEVETLLGDSSKAKKELGWEAKINFKDMIKEMIRSDLEEAEKQNFLNNKSFKKSQ